MSRHTKIISFTGGRENTDSNLEVCTKCGGEFYLYENIVSKRSGSSKRKRYHKKCAEELKII